MRSPSYVNGQPPAMAGEKEGAYGGASTTTGKERKTWDKDEYADKAKAKDAEYRERAKERAEALKSGMSLANHINVLWNTRRY